MIPDLSALEQKIDNDFKAAQAAHRLGRAVLAELAKPEYESASTEGLSMVLNIIAITIHLPSKTGVPAPGEVSQ